MQDDLEQRLAEAARTVRECEAAERRLLELTETTRQLAAERDALHAALGQEERDVARLEGLSLGRVLSALRDARDDDLARERAEADAARYRLAEAQARLDAALAEYRAEHARAEAASAARTWLDRMLLEQERRLKDSPDPRSARLLELAVEGGRLHADDAETREAFEAAGMAAQALDRVLDRLHSASGWSTYDTFFGGGLISSAVKHSRLDDAAEAAAAADRALLVLRRELADVGQVAPVGFAPVQGFTRFADVWFDNIITDLTVGRMIRRSQDGVLRTRQQVDSLQQALLRRRDELAAQRAEVEAERRALLLPK